MRRSRAIALTCLLVCAGVDADARASFLDHFTGGALDPRWTAVTSGQGEILQLEGTLELRSPASTDAAFVRLGGGLDTGSSGLFVFSVSNHGTTPQWWIALVDSPVPPAADTAANLLPRHRLRAGFGQASSTAGILFEYWDANHVRWQWNGVTNAWASSDVVASQPVRVDDYYLIGLEIDGTARRWRLMSWGRRSAGTGYTFEQGLRLFALTDWVDFSSMESSDDLWLLLGDPFTDAVEGVQRVEWARMDAGARHDVWTNAKSHGGSYAIRHGWGYEGTRGAVEFMVPEDRNTLAVQRGASGEWDDDAFGVKDPYVFHDPSSGTYYLWYQSANVAIGFATSSSADGPWAKFAGNPVVVGDAAAGDTFVPGPTVVEDGLEPDTQRRFKLLYCGFDDAGHWRIFMATAPAMSGPWTKRGVILDVGPTGEFDQNGYSRPHPVYYDGEWVVLISAKNTAETGNPWRVTYVSGPGLESLTRSGEILVDRGAGPAADLTADLNGRLVSVASTVGFAPDAFIEIDQDSSASNYGQSRIRRVIDETTLELYHGLDGFAATTPAKVVQIDGANRIQATDVRRVGRRWFMYVTAFQFFGAYPPINAFDENTGLLVADAITGPYVWQHLASPVFTRGSWNNQASNENLSFLHVATIDPDGDGYATSVDCDDGDPAAWELPGETSDLRFAADGETLLWQPPLSPGATMPAYDLLRADDPTGFASNAVCIESNDGSDTTAVDGATPTAAGAAFFYVVRPQNACGVGTAGFRSDGTERVAATCP